MLIIINNKRTPSSDCLLLPSLAHGQHCELRPGSEEAGRYATNELNHACFRVANGIAGRHHVTREWACQTVQAAGDVVEAIGCDDEYEDQTYWLYYRNEENSESVYVLSFHVPLKTESSGEGTSVVCVSSQLHRWAEFISRVQLRKRLVTVLLDVINRAASVSTSGDSRNKKQDVNYVNYLTHPELLFTLIDYLSIQIYRLRLWVYLPERRDLFHHEPVTVPQLSSRLKWHLCRHYYQSAVTSRPCLHTGLSVPPARRLSTLIIWRHCQWLISSVHHTLQCQLVADLHILSRPSRSSLRRRCPLTLQAVSSSVATSSRRHCPRQVVHSPTGPWWTVVRCRSVKCRLINEFQTSNSSFHRHRCVARRLRTVKVWSHPLCLPFSSSSSSIFRVDHLLHHPERGSEHVWRHHQSSRVSHYWWIFTDVFCLLHRVLAWYSHIYIVKQLYQWPTDVDIHWSAILYMRLCLITFYSSSLSKSFNSQL